MAGVVDVAADGRNEFQIMNLKTYCNCFRENNWRTQWRSGIKTCVRGCEGLGCRYQVFISERAVETEPCYGSSSTGFPLGTPVVAWIL